MKCSQLPNCLLNPRLGVQGMLAMHLHAQRQQHSPALLVGPEPASHTLAA